MQKNKGVCKTGLVVFETIGKKRSSLYRKGCNKALWSSRLYYKRGDLSVGNFQDICKRIRGMCKTRLVVFKTKGKKRSSLRRKFPSYMLNYQPANHGTWGSAKGLAVFRTVWTIL